MDAQWMMRCLELARCGNGLVEPNPLVGAVLVNEGRILREGYHRNFGGPHAERVALHGLTANEIPAGSTLYVNLEPCSHQGKTPPCTTRILELGIERVVVAHRDPFPQVNGGGIAQLNQNGVQVEIGVLHSEARWLNRRFLTLHEKKRPYIILKWAQSMNGLMDGDRSLQPEGSIPISGKASRQLAHKWRTEEQAILIGAQTARTDNPTLLPKLVSGRKPLRVIIDPDNLCPPHLTVFTDGEATLRFARNSVPLGGEEVVVLPEGSRIWPFVFGELAQRNILSVLIEGGAFTHRSLLEANLWDEARVFIAPTYLNGTLQAPIMATEAASMETIGNDRLFMWFNPAQLV